MSKLKLGPLPETTPVKMTCTFLPEIHAALSDYARVYEREYGNKERPETLIPFIVEAFLGSDAAFKKARRELPNMPKQSVHQPPANQPKP